MSGEVSFISAYHFISGSRDLCERSDRSGWWYHVQTGYEGFKVQYEESRAQCRHYVLLLSNARIALKVVHLTTKNNFLKIERLHEGLFVKKKNTAHAAQRWFCRGESAAKWSGVLRGGTFFPGWLSAESGGYHGENHHFFSRIWNKGYHGSVGASRWFWGIHCGKAVAVRLMMPWRTDCLVLTIESRAQRTP